MTWYEVLPRILNMSMTASIIFLFVLLCRFFLRRAPKKYSYLLWSVVLFRLLCPISISAPVSLLGMLHTPVVTVTEENTSDKLMTGAQPSENAASYVEYIPSGIVHIENPQIVFPISGTEGTVGQVVNETFPKGEEQLMADPLEVPITVATYLWIVGFLVMVGVGAVSYYRLRRQLIGALHYDKNVYLADHIPTPFVLGVIKPKIYLPSSLEEKAYRYIILHEEYHIRRGDTLLKMLAYFALCVHWFNPLVWLTFHLFVKDMEMSCDEAVINKLGASIRAEYAASILEFASGQKVVFGAPLAFGEGEPAGRIQNLSKWKKPTVIVSVIALFVCGAAVLICIFNPMGKKDTEQSDNKKNQITAENENNMTQAEDVTDKDIGKQGSAGLSNDNHEYVNNSLFDYNHEYNKLLRCYEGTVYLAGADGIYQLTKEGQQELLYENTYSYSRGMELYRNYLYFCGSAMRGDKEAATIYRMNLETFEVEDELALFSQMFDCLYHISIYEDKLYVICGFENKRIGFELDENGQIIRQLDENSEEFLYKTHNDDMDLQWSLLRESFESEKYWELTEESKRRYYSVIDIASCKKLLEGRQVVRKYKDEMYSGIYLENKDGSYEFLCDAIYSLPLLITDTGMYYSYTESEISYLDFQTKNTKVIYSKEWGAEVTPINYDANYVYFLEEHNTDVDESGLWQKETVLLRVPREGGSADLIHRFEEDEQGYGSQKRCAVYENIMFFELHPPILLEPVQETEQITVGKTNEQTNCENIIARAENNLREGYQQVKLTFVENELVNWNYYSDEPWETAEQRDALAQAAMKELYTLTGYQVEDCVYTTDGRSRFIFGQSEEYIRKSIAFYSRDYGFTLMGDSVPYMGYVNARRVHYSEVQQLDSPYHKQEFNGHGAIPMWFLKHSGVYQGQKITGFDAIDLDDTVYTHIKLDFDGGYYLVVMDEAIESVQEVSGPYPKEEVKISKTEFEENYRPMIEKEYRLPGTDICYAMYVVDAACGSRLYALLKSSDSGANWILPSANPFQDASGGSIDFTFLNETLGFATLSHNGGDSALLYVTENGGLSYELVSLNQNVIVTFEDGTHYEPYDYPQMPYMEEGKLMVLVGQGADGDYDGGDRNKLARFISEDGGKNFVFLDYVKNSKVLKDDF